MAKNTRLAQYILPSAGGLCVTYLYNIVDGIFVGQGVGHQALAAVNITVPFITTLVAISSLFAMGGSTVIAIRLGRGDKKGANNAFMCSFIMTLLLSVILLLVGTIFPRQIAQTLRQQRSDPATGGRVPLLLHRLFHSVFAE